MPSLRRKPKGTWYIDYVSSGRRIRQSLATHDEAKARQGFDRWMAEVWPGLQRAPEDRPRTIAALARWHVEVYHRQSAPATRRIGDWAWAAFLRFANAHGVNRIQDITAHQMMAFIAHELSRGLSQTSIKILVQALHSGIRAAVRLETIPADPVGQWPRVHVPRKELDIYTAEQMAAVLDAFRRYAPAGYPVILFLAATGWSIGDVLTLRHDHLDLFRRRAIRLRKKTRVGQRIHLSDAAIRAIGLAGTTRGHVFVKPDGRPITYNSLRENIRTVVRRGGIDFRVYAHKFRHTLATEMARRGMPIRALQAMLGHSTPITTFACYQHYYPGDEAPYLDDFATTLIPKTTEQAPPQALPRHPKS